MDRRELAAAKGGVEVYRGEAMELRRSGRVRFMRNDPASGLTNGETATVESVERGGVLSRLDDGKLTKLGQSDAQLWHIDRAFAATVHAFQGRTVDRILAAMPAANPNLVNQRAFYVSISRLLHAAQLVTDDAHKLADRLERANGSRRSTPRRNRPPELVAEPAVGVLQDFVVDATEAEVAFTRVVDPKYQITVPEDLDAGG